MAARSRPGGTKLGLDRICADIWWQGKCGMKWRDVEKRIKFLLKFEDPPELLLIHCGGNDIGYVPAKKLRQNIRETLQNLQKILPSTLFVWSQILPRKQFRSDKTKKATKALNKSRARLNNSVSYIFHAVGGAYIRYPEITADCSLFQEDGVHLSHVGNDVFLNTIQGGIERFLTSPDVDYP